MKLPDERLLGEFVASLCKFRMLGYARRARLLAASWIDGRNRGIACHVERESVSSRILLIEDDLKLGRQIVATLEEAGYLTFWLQRGDHASSLSIKDYMLAILDLMLPGAFGLDVLKQLRSKSDLPVLVLSAKSDSAIKIRAFELGADDYLTKPFWPDELVARIRARLRRPTMQSSGLLTLGALAIDVCARSVRVHDRLIELTRVEFETLLALARRPGAAIARSWLLENVLDPAREGTERTLDVHISRLRKKLGSDCARIATVWGVGYRIEEPGPS